MLEFFFFKRNFLPQARNLCVRETISFLCSKAVRDDWDLRVVSDVDEVKGGSTANHQSLRQPWAEETREPHSKTWKAIFSGGMEKREEQMRERKKRHRSKGHPEVYHISIQLESEKLSQAQLGVFWRKKLTGGKDHINTTMLNQYIEHTNARLQGCCMKLGPAMLLIPPGCVCKQHRVGASNLDHGKMALAVSSLSQGLARSAVSRSGCSSVEASLSGQGNALFWEGWANGSHYVLNPWEWLAGWKPWSQTPES